MFIDNIQSFCKEYENITKDDFLHILGSANGKGFDLFKLEKDFLLTLILIQFGKIFPNLVFKGGTCLNKIYFPYFRLSEDLDFVISQDIGRTERQTLLKKYEIDFSNELGKLGLTIQEERTKFDEHRLMMLNYEYISVIDGSIQTVKIDISLKGKLLLTPLDGKIQSYYIDKILEEPIFGEHSISCIDLREGLAEKIRAALTRKTPAIRDFFDIWYIKRFGDFNFKDLVFLGLVDKKLAEVDYKYTIHESYKILEKQIASDLEPVLHQEYDFSLREIYDFIIEFSK